MKCDALTVENGVVKDPMTGATATTYAIGAKFTFACNAGFTSNRANDCKYFGSHAPIVIRCAVASLQDGVRRSVTPSPR